MKQALSTLIRKSPKNRKENIIKKLSTIKAKKPKSSSITISSKVTLGSLETTESKNSKISPKSQPRMDLSAYYKLCIEAATQSSQSSLNELKSELEKVKQTYHTREVIEKKRVNAFCFRKNKLLIGTEDCEIKLYRVSKGSISAKHDRLKAHSSSVLRIELTKDARFMFSWALDKTIIFWALNRVEDMYEIKQIIREHKDSYYSNKVDFCWSDDSRVLLARAYHEAVIFTLTDQELLEVAQRFDQKEGLMLNRVFLSSDGKALFSESLDAERDLNIRQLWLLDEDFGKNRKNMVSSGNGLTMAQIVEKVDKSQKVASAHFYHDRSTLVVVENRGRIKIFSKKADLEGYTKTVELMTGKSNLGPAHMSKKGKYLVVGSMAGECLFYKHNRGAGYELVNSANIHSSAMTCVQISDSLAYIITGSKDKTVKLRSTRRVLELHQTKRIHGKQSGDEEVVCSAAEEVDEIKVSSGGQLMVLLTRIEVENAIVKKSIKFFSREKNSKKFKKIKSFLTRSSTVAVSDSSEYTLTSEVGNLLRYHTKQSVAKQGQKTTTTSISFLDSIRTRQGKLTAIEFFKGKEDFLTGAQNGSIKVWANDSSFKKVNLIHQIMGETHSKVVGIQTFFNNFGSFLTALESGLIQLWERDRRSLTSSRSKTRPDDERSSQYGEYRETRISPAEFSPIKKILNFYATQKQPRLIITANSSSEILVYKRCPKMASSNSPKKFKIAQNVKKSWSACCLVERYFLEVFDNEEYMMTMAGRGEHVMLWYIHNNGLIQLYSIGQLHILATHPALETAFLVQKSSKNVVNVTEMRSGGNLPPDDFQHFKLIESLFNVDLEGGGHEGVINKQKISSVVRFYSRKLSRHAQEFFRRNTFIKISTMADGGRGGGLRHVVDALQLQIAKNREKGEMGHEGQGFIKITMDEFGEEPVELQSGIQGSLKALISPKQDFGFRRRSSQKSRRKTTTDQEGTFKDLPSLQEASSKRENRLKSLMKSQAFIASYSGFQRLKDDRIIHAELNPVLLAVLSKEPKILSKKLKKFGHKPFYYKTTKIDPFDVTIKMNNLGVLDTIAKHIKDSYNASTNQGNLNSTKNLFLSYLSIQRFRKIMECSSESLKEITMEQSFVEPVCLDTKLIELYPTSAHGFQVFKTGCLLFDQELKNQISRKAEAKAKLEKSIPVRVKMFRFPFSSSLFSKSAKNLLEASLHMSDSMLKTDFKYVIIYIWNQNFYTVFGMTCYNILVYILFVLFTVWFQDVAGLGVLSIAISSSLLFYEVVVAFNDLRRWSRSFHNYLDVFQHVNMPLIVALSLTDCIAHEELGVNLWVNLTLLIGGLRTFAELRIFDSIRTLIAMINQTMIDMTSFMVTIFVMTLIFCILSINASKTTEKPMLRFKDLLKNLDYYYNLANGNWEPDITHDLNSSELINFYLSGIILAIMMMNLLIAVISLTFDQFYQIQELVDLRERAVILYDHSIFFSKVRGILGLGNKPNTEDLGLINHCFLIKNEASLSDEMVSNFKELNRQVGEYRDEFDQLKELVKDEIEDVRSGLEKRIGEVNQNMERRLDELKDLVLTSLEAQKI